MKHLFIQQCNALIGTMLFCKKEQQTRELIMDDWVKEKKCGYVACVLGHHATMQVFSDVAPFEKDNLILLSTIANQFAKQLLNACIELFSNSFLASSIYASHYKERRSHARESNLFTDEELETLNHLNRKEPTFEDVVWYLEFVIHKTEQFLEQSA